MDKKAMYKLSYGLFVLTAKEGEKDNHWTDHMALQNLWIRICRGRIARGFYLSAV